MQVLGTDQRCYPGGKFVPVGVGKQGSPKQALDSGKPVKMDGFRRLGARKLREST